MSSDIQIRMEFCMLMLKYYNFTVEVDKPICCAFAHGQEWEEGSRSKKKRVVLLLLKH